MRRTKRITLALVGALLLVGAITYGFVLRLPFFSDDLIMLRWLDWHTLPGIWSTSRGIGYFRPLPFSIWKVLAALQGRYDPMAAHAVNLGLHLLNTLLVFALVAGRKREKSLPLGFGAALLFLLFPFSYQAVPWVGSLTHLLVVALILSSLLLYRTGARRGAAGRPYRVASLALALLAPFAHETGVLVFPLLFLLLLTDERPEPWQKVARRIWPFILCSAVGAAVYLLVPKSVNQHSLLNLTDRWQNGTYFGQGLVYPIDYLAPRLLTILHRPDSLLGMGLIALAVSAFWALLLWRLGQGKLVALALGWFVILSVPAWAMLPFAYIQDGPRLLYEASVGVALFWAIPLEIRWPSRWQRIAGATLASAVLLLAAGSGYRFIRARVPLYEQMRLAVEELLAAQPADVKAPILCINYPWWFAPPHNDFVAGHEGVTLVPSTYSSINDLLWLETGEERPVKSVVLMDLLPQGPWRYLFACVGSWVNSDSVQEEVRHAQQVIVTRYGEGSVSVQNVGGLEAENQQAAAGMATFGQEIGLAAASCTREGSTLRLELHWQCQAPISADCTVFLHLYDQSGKLVTQSDGYPLDGLSRPMSWRLGDAWRDVRQLSLPGNLPAGRYTVKIGFYDRASGARLPAVDPAGQRFTDDAVPIASLTLP